jgi:hypothetical protein
MYRHNAEPTVEELLNDPIAHLLMARDRLQPEDVWACVENTRQRLGACETQQAEAVPSRRDGRRAGARAATRVATEPLKWRTHKEA